MPFPDVSAALNGWTTSFTIKIVTKTVVDHRVSESVETRTLAGVLEPLPPEQVERKPTEQRSWAWFRLWVKEGLRSLKIDDIITVDSTGYRVRSLQPWVTGGYSTYELTEDYTGGT